MTYDGVGNRTGVTSGVTGQAALSGATAYTYDAKDQLTQESSARVGGYTNNYAYDPAGNPTTFKGAARTYNAKNQLTNTGFGYDSNGNPTTYNGLAATFNVNDCLTSLGAQLTAGYTGGGLRAWKPNSVGTRTPLTFCASPLWLRGRPSRPATIHRPLLTDHQPLRRR